MIIGIISDTHGYFNPLISKHFAHVDEIWHAGDIGDLSVIAQLEKMAPVRAVYGNIDNRAIRYQYSDVLHFEVGLVKVMLTHIGGYPGRYAPGIRPILLAHKPDVFVCGHSHILKVQHDKGLNLLHINPGAAGVQGFHQVSTILRLQIADTIKNLEVIEFSKRMAP